MKEKEEEDYLSLKKLNSSGQQFQASERYWRSRRTDTSEVVREMSSEEHARSARLGESNVVFRISKGRGTVFAATKSRVLSYEVFKAEIDAVRDDIKAEIRSQHEVTRREIVNSRLELLDAIKASPSEYVKLMCEITSALCIFFLALRYLLKVELVNPIFSGFSIFACAVYWSMASIKQKSEKIKRKNNDN
jgi:hypothetical protein